MNKNYIMTTIKWKQRSLDRPALFFSLDSPQFIASLELTAESDKTLLKIKENAQYLKLH